ncbi:glutamyl-Q tRNA(Asp) ligase [Bifidobacterium lemurum]|uniref:Glutamyl-Q tRNA(Asp) ligase n=1 Tax=Bifidobacterium lemurum TaxID=1603886 RepID=A0A261FRW1_9BIFI|nr:glutamyl-Q tRNA(Asp) synthetase [Bifidobacterium lemurum]OZG61930.1 glutamyl-Q tRNA(Asp) ligase [Bifidobacterium lemurum]QOL35289.1 glutamyl-Q tRNA(Asp) synthetase [Bifidobacterium lemurum]
MTGRFAPTPSGRMHIGNAYAMLAAWLDARSRGERMLLRIEDVDTPRVLPDADRLLMDDLVWLGLDWDGEAVYQSSPERHARYEEALTCLANAGLVYPCFCSRADLRAASAPNEGDGFMIYPGTCRRLLEERPDEVTARLARGDRHSLRIVMPGGWAAPHETAADAYSGFVDEVFGPQLFNLPRMVGDSVVRRADGLFAYQLVVVVDDLDMGVDRIVRGRDLLRSTALQRWIRASLLRAGFVPQAHAVSPTLSAGEAVNGEPTVMAVKSHADDGLLAGASGKQRNAAPSAEHPTYAHLPLIDNAAGKRLAKRERSLDMGALRARGVTPEQVVGYCAYLLNLRPDAEPCSAAELVPGFSWEPLRAEHDDRAVDPSDPLCPHWLVER